MATDIAVFTTTVKNTSGKTKRFSFLPPHGRMLANNETVTFVGDMISALYSPDKSTKRQIAALERALLNNEIEILHGPAPVLYDAGATQTKAVLLHNGTLTMVAPSWNVGFSIGSPG